MLPDARGVKAVGEQTHARRHGSLPAPSRMRNETVRFIYPRRLTAPEPLSSHPETCRNLLRRIPEETFAYYVPRVVAAPRFGAIAILPDGHRALPARVPGPPMWQ